MNKRLNLSILKKIEERYNTLGVTLFPDLHVCLTHLPSTEVVCC